MPDGYFQTMYKLAKDPIDQEVVYVYFGFAIVFSPILLPLWYIGRAGEVVLNA